MGQWLAENWFNLTSVIGIVGGLSFTAFSLHSETKTRRVANLLAITANYLEVWKEIFYVPELLRIIESTADVAKDPVTPIEEFGVSRVVSHTGSVYEALKNGLMINQEGLRKDVGDFFSLPVPSVVWKQLKHFQNEDFVEFVDACCEKRSL